LGAAADYQFRHGQLDQCEVLLRRLLEADADKPTSAAYAARRTLALVLAMRSGFGDFREALALLEQNLQQGGHRLEDLRAKAKLLATRPIRKYQREAISVLLALDEIAPLNATDQLQLVHLYLDVGHWPHARDALQALLANHNDQPDVLAFGIRTLLDHGEPAGQAPQWLARLEQLEPDSDRTRALRVRLLVARSEFDPALELLDQAAQRDAADRADGLNWLATAAADLALSLDRSGRTVIAEKFAAAAEALYRRMMQAQPEQVLALARFMGRQWRLREALDLCQQAWEAAPPEQVAVVCVELLRSGRASAEDCSLVRAWLETAVAKHPDSAELAFQLANVAHVQHDFQSAEQFYRKTIELAPWSILAYNELALLLALQESGPPAALELVERAIELSGPRDFLLDTRATVRLALGQTDLALRDLEEAIADSPTPAKYFHLAQLHLERNDRPAADAAYRQGLAAGLHADALHPLERTAFDELHATLQQF
jgi:tetratricopeptide (TPR) repeat protein